MQHSKDFRQVANPPILGCARSLCIRRLDLAATEPLTASSLVQSPPVAEKRPYNVVAPGGTRVDEYYWLRDDTRQDAKMLAHP